MYVTLEQAKQIVNSYHVTPTKIEMLEHQAILNEIENDINFEKFKEQKTTNQKAQEHNEKLTPKQVIAIRKSDLSNAKLAKMYNVSPQCIFRVKNKITYTWV
jgi:DNA-binding transcriptional regulator YiaG